MNNNKQPLLVVVAGPNGAGKTTFVEQISTQILAGTVFINPDNIAKKLKTTFPEKKEEHLNFMAGREALKLYESYVAEKKSFSMETTLSGHSPINSLKKAKENGFETILIYIGINSTRVSRYRINERVLKGGHNIPDEDIVRRYDRSMNNLIKAIVFADKTMIFDNSFSKRHTLLLELEKDVLKNIENIPFPNWTKLIIDCDKLKIGRKIIFR